MSFMFETPQGTLDLTPGNTECTLQDIAIFIIDCCDTESDLKHLDHLLTICKNDLNDHVFINSNTNIGLGCEFTCNRMRYIIREYGLPASLVHFASVAGRPSVLRLLMKHKVFLYSTVVVTTNKLKSNIQPSHIAYANGHKEFFNIIESSRSSVSYCILN